MTGTTRPLRGCSVLAWSGAAALVAGTVLHPAGAQPRDSAAAFAEYAAQARGLWWLSHLLQLAGVVALVLAVLGLAGERAGSGGGATRARAVRVLGAAGIAIAAVLQAVDGVALKAMTDLWAASSGAERDTWFAAAVAVRQVEIGLDAVLGLCLGTVLVLVGAGPFLARGGPRLLGAAALLVGAVTAVGGVLTGLAGYSDAAMTVTMVSGPGAVLFAVALGGWAWQLPGGDRRPPVR